MRRPASLAPRCPVAIRPRQARHRSPPLSPVVMGRSDRLRATQGAVGAEHGRGVKGGGFQQSHLTPGSFPCCDTGAQRLCPLDLPITIFVMHPVSQRTFQPTHGFGLRCN